MGIITPTVSQLAGLRRRVLPNGGDVLGIEQFVGPVTPGRLLRLAAKELVLKGANLPLGLTEFLRQLFVAFQGVSMPAFPIAHLPTEFGPQLLHRPLQALHGWAVGTANAGFRHVGRMFQEHGAHDATLYLNRPL